MPKGLLFAARRGNCRPANQENRRRGLAPIHFSVSLRSVSSKPAAGAQLAEGSSQSRSCWSLKSSKSTRLEFSQSRNCAIRDVTQSPRLRPIFPKLASMEQTYNNLRYGRKSGVGQSQRCQFSQPLVQADDAAASETVGRRCRCSAPETMGMLIRPPS